MTSDDFPITYIAYRSDIYFQECITKFILCYSFFSIFIASTQTYLFFACSNNTAFSSFYLKNKGVKCGSWSVAVKYFEKYFFIYPSKSKIET